MKLILSLILTFLSFNAFSICMYPEDAELYECLPMESSSATKWCQDKYGAEFDAFLTNNTCSKELAFSLRGETYKEKESDTTGQVNAACMSYEQGQNLGCEYYDYKLAQNFCSENFGMKYIAFVPSSTCSLEKAASLRGEVSSARLLDNLDSGIDELDSLITMIDQEGSLDSLSNIGSKEILIGNEFYTKTMTKILSYMKMSKNTLYKNSQLNVKLKSDKYVISFLRQALKYSSLLSRIYKIYAYVAHKNTYVLKSYDFENLKSLNLVLKKEFALELLSKINFKVKHVNNNKDIEFIVSEQEKQNFEYMAIANPKSKMEYAKLLSFMGSREVVTNHWAVQRLTSNTIANDNTRSCGNGYLSLRPKQNTMTKSDAYRDLWEYDVFFNDYATRWEDIVKTTWDLPLLSDSDAKKLMRDVFASNSALVAQIENNLYDSDIKSELSNRVESDGEIFKDAEDLSWMNFSNYHFSTIVFPGDDILNKNNVIARIAEEAYRVRSEAIVDTFVAMYPYMKDSEIRRLENSISSFLEENVKVSFTASFKRALEPSFANYNSKEFRRSNREKKVDETLEAIKNSATAIAVEMELQKETPMIRDMKIIHPHNMKELILVFENGMSQNLSATLKHDKDKAKLVESFFKEINTAFISKYTSQDSAGNTILSGTRSQRENGLREIAYNTAVKYFKKYPYHAVNSSLLKEQYIGRTVAIDNTYVKKPIYRSNRVIPMKKEQVLREFDKDKILKDERYTVARDNTRVYMPKIITGDYTTKTKNSASNAGYNKDKISTGEFVINDTISEKDLKDLRNTDLKKENSELYALLKDTTAYGSKASKKTLNTQLSQSLENYSKSLVIESDEELFHELFKALNLNSRITQGVTRGFGLASSNHSQLNLANHYISGAYQVAPILRSEVYWTTRVEKVTYNNAEPYHYTETKEVSGQLAKRIVDVAYNQKTGAFNESKARELINQAFDNTIKNASNKVSDYCSANYVNYKNDDSFKKIFKASTFLRANLKSPSGVSSENHKRIQKYDEQIKKEIRSKMEALNEDWLEPILIYSGTIAIIALAVTFCIGTGGTGIPAAIAGVASLLGTIDMVISAPIIAASLYARVQTHFIEMPSQLKFNQSLAHSQLGDSSIINWDMHRNAKKEFKNQQLWQIGYMALDVFFIGSLGQHVKRTAGVVARSAYKRATGIKLRGWSAPTANMYRNIKFAEYRKTNNFFKAVGKRIGNKVDKIRLYQPRYQDMPLSMIKTTALRQGLNKVAKSSKIANKPWTLLDDMKAYSKKLAQRTTEFKAYSKAEGKVIREVYGNNIKVGELFKFGRKYSSFNFVLKSFKKAAVENRLKSYFLNFGDELNELRKMRGELIDGRVKDIQLAIDKLEDLKLAKAAKGKSLVGTGDEFSEFLSKLSDDEILALEEVVKKSPKNSLIRNFKSAFKDYNKVATGFRNPGYMKDIENMSKSAGKIIYPHTSVMGDDVVANYKFDSDAEDIVNFYESMIKQNNAKGEKVDQIRENIENGLSKFFIYDQYGNRIFNK